MNQEDKINQELLDTFQAADLIIKLDYLPDYHPSAIFWKEKYLNLLDDYTDLLKSQAKK